MSSEEEILVALTPALLEQVILEIAGEKAERAQRSIAVGRIADQLLQGQEFSSAGERTRMHIRLSQKIGQQVVLIQGMRYIENE